AVKIIRLGRDTKQILQRFEHERQTLALMSHPNIATILDAGTTRLGRPYFVMELVDGQPVDVYCDARKCNINQRLKLFVNLCHAVQHAHLKGVVHRDLKPSNVLVADIEGRAVPKVIDFGIAKAMPSVGGTPGWSPSSEVEAESEELASSKTTQSLAVGTPNYMSPEQICAGSDVDTRADVYALGAILHQLLVGCPPQRTELHKEPHSQPMPTLLDCVEDSDRQLEAAENRRTQWRTLQASLRGELQWIVDKALAYSASERYQSVSELAKDVESHLGRFPLTVGPPTTLYRFQKFVWRNSLSTSLLLVAVLAILIGSVVAVVSFAREREANLLAEHQEKRAEIEVQRAALEANRATKFVQLLERIMDAADPRSGKPATQTLRAELKEFADLVRTQLVDYPLSEARLQRTVGRIFRSHRQFEEAGPHLERAHLLRSQHLPTGNPDLLQSQVDYAEFLYFVGRVDESQSLVEPALAQLTDDEITLAEVEALALLSQIRRSQRQKPESYQLMYNAWQKATALKGPKDPLTLKYQAKAARKLLSSGRKREALDLESDALDKMLEVRHENHIDVAEVKRDLGLILRIQRDYETAEKLARESLAVFRESTGENSVFAASSLILLARVLKDDGRRQEALEVGHEAAKIVDATPAGSNSYTKW
ncbi:MAG: serine/threonine-protein kinase, partial [Planctomycetota bacterium]